MQDLHYVCRHFTVTKLPATTHASTTSFQIDLEVVPVSELRGHEDAVQAVQFDPKGNFLVSGSSDSTFRVWGSFESKSKAGRAENPESSNDYPC